ncbi:small secreted hydrophilic protein [Streptomyces sp. NPDC057702]|uniref:small secreted hydrophilic protein n=1 Tax=unclassified Streptomyces TaxID=2593676 RepID=UPI00367E5651
MPLTHRLATLTAVVAIPLGIAVTSYLLTDAPDAPRAPAKVELESGSPSPGPTGSPPAPPPARTSPASPGDEAVPPPPATDGMADDTADDTAERDDDGADDRDDGPGDDG